MKSRWSGAVDGCVRSHLRNGDEASEGLGKVLIRFYGRHCLRSINMFGFGKNKRSERGLEHDTPMLSMADSQWRAIVWRLTSISRAEFDATYLPFFHVTSVMLEKARRVDVKRASQADELRLMKQILALLKVRQAQIIPRRLTIEDASRMSETVSFALVAAMVLDQAFNSWSGTELLIDKEAVCPLISGVEHGQLAPASVRLDRVSALLLLPTVLSPTALKWLWREPVVMNEIGRFFTLENQSEFAQVIMLARSKVAEEDRLQSRGYEREGEAVSPPSDAIQCAAKETTAGDPETDVRVKPIVGTPQAPQRRDAVVLPEKTRQTERVATGAELYLHWLRAQIKDGAMTVNEEDSVIHLLRDGTVFSQVPDCFDAFAKARGKTAKTIQNQLSRSNVLRRRSDGTRVFVAEHKTLGRVHGVVFHQKEILWDDEGVGLSVCIEKVK